MSSLVQNTIGGLLGNQKEGGRTAGNVFANNSNRKDFSTDDFNSRILNGINDNAHNTVDNATKSIMGNPIYSSLFGKGGQLEQTENDANNLLSQGFKLQPQDIEAYGQAAGNIARQFDQSEGSLAQALSARGLDSSGVAGKAFMTSQGNKNEALAQMQMQIANERMQNTMKRLSDARSFMSSLGGQAHNAIGQQLDNENRRSMNEYNSNMGYLANRQDQSNTNLNQELGSEHNSTWANTANGAVKGYNDDAKMILKAALGGGGGGTLS